MFRSALAAATLALTLGCAHTLGAAAIAPTGHPAAMAACSTPTRSLPACGHDLPAVHGMLLVGRKTLYLSHLPMFHAPHDYQVILEVHLRGTSGDPAAAYNHDRDTTGAPLYTLVPEPFVLPDVVAHHRSFGATIFRGHFERGGVPILEHVTVDIQRVVLFRHFEPGAVKPTHASYLLFGKGDETFLAHWIVAAPDFDQMLAVKPQTPIADAVQAAGLPVTLADRTDDQAATVGETLSAGAADGPHALVVATELYHETGDLAR